MSRVLHKRYGRAARVAGLTTAVQAMRLYLGGVDFASVRDQQRLYNRMISAIERVARATGMDAADVQRQVEAEARRQGVIRPMPGQHL
jgi:hypothetical protein